MHFLRYCGILASARLWGVRSCEYRTVWISSCLMNTMGKNQKSKQKQSSKFQNCPKPVLRHIRYVSEKGPVIPGTIDMQVVGTGAGASPRAVTCDFTHSRYLFNCSEGTQRVCTEHKMRLAKLENIFITHTSWKNIGGLLGMALTLDGVNVPRVTVHGPPDADKLVKLSRHFAPIRSLQFEKRELSEGQFRDNAMIVDSIPFFPSNAAADEEDSTQATVAEPAPKKAKMSLSEQMLKFNEAKQKQDGEKNMSIAYVCTPLPKPRPVSLQKCVKLGLKPSPLIGKLKNGETVTLEDGRVVKPEDVLEDTESELPFIVVEAPTEAYLDSLLASKDLSRYQGSEEKLVQIVVHFTPKAVMEHPRYQLWMSRFHREVDHLLVNDAGSPVCYEGLYRLQTKLNMLHPLIFPLLPHLTQLNKSSQDESNTLIKSETALRYLLRMGHKKAETRLSRENCFTLDKEAFKADIHPESQFGEHLTALQEKLQVVEKEGLDKPKYPELLFLGTGSAMPNRERNVSAILLNTSETESMLLDCGEDTYGQLYRNYDMLTPGVLQQIKGVFLSHLHADHHMGLYGVLHHRLAAFKEAGLTPTPVHLLVTENVTHWLESLTHTLDPEVMAQVKLVPLEYITHNSNEYNVQVASDCRSYLNMQLVEAVRVSHRQHPYGIVVSHKDGWKLSYSGDTTPCRTFVTVGEGSDILIHEATMEDDMHEEAKNKRHSTMSQAIAVGQEMKAKFIILTHFSQRYAKIPPFRETFTDNVGIAFDNMKVNPQQLHLLPLFKTALRSLFYEQYQDMETQTYKRNRKKLIEQGITDTEVIEDLVKKQAAPQPLPWASTSGDHTAAFNTDIDEIFNPKTEESKQNPHTANPLLAVLQDSKTIGNAAVSEKSCNSSDLKDTLSDDIRTDCNDQTSESNEAKAS